jgi:hypothetical protein
MGLPVLIENIGSLMCKYVLKGQFIVIKLISLVLMTILLYMLNPRFI